MTKKNPDNSLDYRRSEDVTGYTFCNFKNSLIILYYYVIGTAVDSDVDGRPLCRVTSFYCRKRFVISFTHDLHVQITTPTTTRTWKTTWRKRIVTRRTSAGRADGHWRISTPTSTNTLADRGDNNNNNNIRAAALLVVDASTPLCGSIWTCTATAPETAV